METYDSRFRIPDSCLDYSEILMFFASLCMNRMNSFISEGPFVKSGPLIPDASLSAVRGLVTLGLPLLLVGCTRGSDPPRCVDPTHVIFPGTRHALSSGTIELSSRHP